MFYLIVTNDKKVVEFARKHGAGIFTSEKLPEGTSPVVVRTSERKPMGVYELLQKLGVRPNIKGYDYLKFLMEKCESDAEYRKRAIIKEIYPECAEKFDTTPSRVERAIQHALEQSFVKAPEKYSEVFGGEFKEKPTNSEFIGLVSEYFANNK